MGFVEPIKTFPLPLIKSEIRIKNKKNKNKRGITENILFAWTKISKNEIQIFLYLFIRIEKIVKTKN